MRDLGIMMFGLTLTLACGGGGDDAKTSADPSGKPASSAAAGSGPSDAKKKALITEAKNNLGKLARGAMTAYERESFVEGAAELKPEDPPPESHHLCKSATPLGAKVPEGGASFDVAEKDLDGSEAIGWKCLRADLRGPAFFQYTYTLGATPKHAARGKDLGKDDPNAFEICAEADFIPGGKTTLVCHSGTIATETKTVRLSTQLFVADEGE